MSEAISGRHPFGPSTITRKKSELFCHVTPGLYRLVTRRYVLEVLYRENRPKSEKWANLTPRSSAIVRRREKLTDLGNSLALGLQSGVNSISLQCILYPALSEVPVWPIFDLRFLEKMTPKVNIFENVFPDSATRRRTTFGYQIWWKSAVVKLPKGSLDYHTQKTQALWTCPSLRFA